MGYWGIAILFVTVMVGGALGFFVKEANTSKLKLVLSFGGAYIFGISVLHLMPEIFGTGIPRIGLWVIGGFFLQLILEQFSQGVEHAHIHAHKNASGRFAIQIMIGLCLHAFLEGIPLGGGNEFHIGHDHPEIMGNYTNALLWGIVLHKIPAAFALVLVLIGSGFSKKLVWLCLIAFAIMSPLGAFLGVQTDWFHGSGSIYILAVVLGSFIHIATTILFEVENKGHHSISWPKLIAIIIGIALAILTIF